MLARSPGGQHWAAYESCLVVPRQNGKSVLLEAYGLAKLFLSEPPHLILHTAHLFPTAMESFQHLSGLVRNCPDLMAEVARIPLAHGEEGIYLRNGNRLRFMARTVTGAGRGFSPDDVIFDEAYRLPLEVKSALMPALSAKPDPQLVYTSSTGYPESDELWTLVQRGRAGDDPTLWYGEWSAESWLADFDSPQVWAQANPALGIRLSERKTLAERASMSPPDFARERLGLWAEVGGGVINAQVWAAAQDPGSAVRDPVAFAVDVTPDRSMAAIAVAGARDDGLVHVEVVDHRPGTAWVVPRILELRDRWWPVCVAVDGSGPAGALLIEFEERSVEIEVPTSREYGQACGQFFDAVVDAKQIRHLGQPMLDEAVKAAVRRDVGDAWAWSRRNTDFDISPLVAVTLAVWGHAKYATSGDVNAYII